MARTMIHQPKTYKVYPVQGGWTILFMEGDGTLRTVDGPKKVYPHYQNAAARCKRLNHPIEHALRHAECVEAWHDGYTLSVRSDESEDEPSFVLSIGKEAMPPFLQREFKSVREVEEFLREKWVRFLYLDWQKVEFV